MAAGEGLDFAGKKDARGQLETQFCSLCGAWRGELGGEPDYNLYLDHLIAIYDEVFRVLRPDGNCWVNLGTTMQDKNDAMIPERFAIAMVDRGWIKRRTVVWQKLNPMPSSVKDDFTSDFEYVYRFVKSNEALHWVRPDGKMSPTKPDHKAGKEGLDWEWGIRQGKKVKLSLWQGWSYYFEPQYEPAQYGFSPTIKGEFAASLGGKHASHTVVRGNGSTGRNMRTTWTIPTEAFSEAHFATFPRKLVEPMILAGCPAQVCTACGAPRKKVYETTGGTIGQDWNQHNLDHPDGRDPNKTQKVIPAASDGSYKRIFKGCSDCGCNKDLPDGERFKPGIVLDMFLGSGCTAQVAAYLRRDYIGIELNPAYISMAKRRIAQGETGIPVKEQQQGQRSLFPAPDAACGGQTAPDG